VRAHDKNYIFTHALAAHWQDAELYLRLEHPQE